MEWLEDGNREKSVLEVCFYSKGHGSDQHLFSGDVGWVSLYCGAHEVSWMLITKWGLMIKRLPFFRLVRPTPTDQGKHS